MEKITNVSAARLMYAIFNDEARPFILRLLSKEELYEFLLLNFKEKENDGRLRNQSTEDGVHDQRSC